jgi:hypothetical protein
MGVIGQQITHAEEAVSARPAPPHLPEPAEFGGDLGRCEPGEGQGHDLPLPARQCCQGGTDPWPRVSDTTCSTGPPAEPPVGDSHEFTATVGPSQRPSVVMADKVLHGSTCHAPRAESG